MSPGCNDNERSQENLVILRKHDLYHNSLSEFLRVCTARYSTAVPLQ